MKYLTREEILNSKDITEEDIDCTKWGGKIKIKSLSLEKRQSIKKAATRTDGTDQLDDLKMSIATFIEGVVEPKFTPNDFNALKEKSYETMMIVLNRICEISGIGVDLKNGSKAAGTEAK
jgi:hypothetical protein